MTTIWAERALLPSGWAEAVAVAVGDGRVVSATPGAAPSGERVGLLVPAPADLHVHSFQRAMAGLAERRGPGRDSFWTWREAMYALAGMIDPDGVEAVAAMTQMEMLEAGHGASAEFHYLHHAPGGAPYDDPAETSARIAAAAETSGIGLTLLPVLYRFGGCGGRPLGPGQARFGSEPDRYARLVEGAAAALAPLPDARIGAAPHSLRAVAPGDLALCAVLTDGPVHMHLAEQVAEVEEVRAALGARPVRWMLDHADLGPRWCLIHCTQMEPAETEALARTGAVAGLCPRTEADLGDGVFDGTRWLGRGGAFGVGADSAVGVDLAGELRQLETSQRLRDRARVVLAEPGRSTGRRLIEDAARGGARALGRGSGTIAPGEPADLLALDAGHPDLAGLGGDGALDVLVMATRPGMVADVWSGGRHVVRGGRHVRRDAIVAAYARAVAPLRAAL